MCVVKLKFHYRLKNVENLPQLSSCETLNPPPSANSLLLPPIDPGRSSPIAPQDSGIGQILPRIPLLDTPELHQRRSSLPVHTDGACFKSCHLDRYDCSYLKCLLAEFEDEPAYQNRAEETQTTEMKMEASRSFLPTSGLRETDMEWQTFSLQELDKRCSEISPDRPPYSSNELNIEPEQPVKKAPKSQIKATDCGAETLKEKSRKKHADTERYRRYEHKKSLVFMYEHVSDYALETAGKKVNWTLDSAKAPTKDVILAACNIHVLMVERMNMLSQEQLAKKDRVIEQKDREIHVRDQAIRYLVCVLEECCEQTHSREARKNVIQRSALIAQGSSPFRTHTQGQHQRIFFPDAEGGQFTCFAEDRNLPPVEPAQSSPQPSEWVRNSVSGFTKRKWGTVKGDTSSGDPLPHDVPKRSHQHSPCSTISSRGSWCLVESSL